MQLNFILGEFKVTLQNYDLTVVQIYSRNFSVTLNVFDSENKYNKHNMEVAV